MENIKIIQIWSFNLKIVIFEPHPDDLLFGTGPIIFDWIEEGHDIHIITVTDGRACYRGHKDISMSENDVADMRIKEAKATIKFLGLPKANLHLLKFPDSKAWRNRKEGIKEVQPLIKDADRILIPSNNNGHKDHQATHTMAVGAAKELGLDIEYYVYFIPSYGVFKSDSKDKQFEITITEELRSKLQEWLQIYQSQKKTEMTWKFYTRYLRRMKKVIYGIFKFDDIGKYYNF